MIEELKVCPFCNSAGIVKPYRTGIRIKCSKCGVISGQYATRGEALEAWNKRPEEEVQEGKLKTVLRTVQQIQAELRMLEELIIAKETENAEANLDSGM